MPGAGQRRAQVGIPALRVVDARDPVAPALDDEVGAEQSGRDRGHLRHVAAAHVRVADGDLGAHVVEQVVQIGAVPHVRQELPVHLLHLRPVGAVHVRHVQVVALVAPTLIEDLPELLLRIEVHAQRGRDAPLAGRLSRRIGAAARAAPARPRAFIRSGRGALLVALGQQGARLALLEHGQVQPEVLLAVVRRHVEPLRPQAEVRGRQKPQVLPARVEHGIHRVGQAVGDLFRFTRVHIRDHDRDVQHPHLQVGVVVQELLRVRRPRRRVVVRRVRQRELARRFQAVLLFDNQLVLARPVAEVRHELPVRRPRGVALGRPARVGYVPHVAFFSGNREDLAARLDDDALAGGGEGEVRHARRHVLPARHHPREIARRRDLDRTVAARLRVEQVNHARLLEHHGARVRVERLHVEVAELRDLREPLRLGVE